MRNIVLLSALFFSFAGAHAAPPRSTTVQGNLYGGQQPVTGARVYLLTPGTTAGAPSSSLMVAGTKTSHDDIGYFVTSDANGNWDANGTYTCTTGVPVYAYARYGNPGFASGTNNTAISLMSYVGVCGKISSLFVNINEVSTIAMAYSVAGFATDPLHISYSGSSLGFQGIVNAFTNQFNLESLGNGVAYTKIPSGFGTVPQATIYTLADDLANCVNSTSPSSGECTQLFNVTTSDGTSNGKIPIDTATAAINIAHNPTANVQTLVYMPTPTAPFQPALSAVPNDLTIGITFSGNGIADAYAIAIDKFGNAWIASQAAGTAYGTPTSNTASIVEIDNPQTMIASNQTMASPAAGFASSEFAGRTPYAIGIDPSSTSVWIGTDATLDELALTSGVPVAGSPFLYSSAYPGPNPDDNFGSAYALSLDRSGDVWVAAETTIYEVSPSGSVANTTAGGYSLGTTNGIANMVPTAIAIDATSNVWVTDGMNNVLVQMTPQGQATTILGGSLFSPDGVAIDNAGNVWIANNNSSKAAKYSQNNKQYVSSNGYTLGNSAPQGEFVAMDGTGNSWFALTDNYCTNSSNVACIGTVELANATGAGLSGASGFDAGGFNNGRGTLAIHYGAAIDGSGNEWIANTSSDSVTELVGASVPVVTPIAASVLNGTIGSRP